MTGTAFAISDHVGGQWEGYPVMNEKMLIDLSSAGWEIGSHTKTHPTLVNLPTERLDEELGSSKQRLELLIKKPVTTLSYPYGQFDSKVVLRAKRHYTCARASSWYPPLKLNSSNPKDPMRLNAMTETVKADTHLPAHLYLTYSPMTVRQIIHRILQKAKLFQGVSVSANAPDLTAKILAKWIRRMHRNTWLILCLHNIAPDGTASSPYSVNLNEFREMLKVIASASEEVVTVGHGCRGLKAA